MSCTKYVRHMFAGFAILVLFSAVASAQSTISGQVKDTSGAVMAGVKVEAASPVLIEGSRGATTDGEGRYAIVDVRPGTYTMTFTMSGFSTVKQQAEVPSNVTVPVDATMQVGAVGQTVEVQAQVATVDVENVAHPDTLSRSDMDDLPSARNMQSIGSYVPGVHLNLPDVGGSQQTEQAYMAVHGNPAWRDVYLLDGMRINTTLVDGEIQIYVDNALIQESTYQTTNVGAEVQGGGVYTNLIPKDGGNDFHGALFLGYVPNAFVSSDITPELIARGVTGQSRVTKLEDFDGSIGGPIIKDKLWFLVSGRKQLSWLQSAGSFYLNGTPGVEKTFIYTGAARLTYQINPKNKLAVMWTRDWKTKVTDVVTDAGGYSDIQPNVASLQRYPVMYYIMQARWTGTLTPKLLVEAGFSYTKLDYDINYHTGVLQPEDTDAFYADAEELDVGKLTRQVSGGINTYSKYERYVIGGNGAYVTGSHNFRFGITDDWGPVYVNYVNDGDAYYEYLNGVPLQILAYNTPVYEKPYMKADTGIYGIDTWHFKRLAITGGLRWEYYSGEIQKQTAPAGRFVPARSFPEEDCSTIKGMGCFKDWLPRLGAVYDLFGNHKTALKAGIGKYNTPITSGILANFNPMILASETIQWLNRPTTACETTTSGGIGAAWAGTIPGCIPAGTTFGTGNIGPNPNPSFGVAPNISLDPNYHREYQWQYSLGVQHEISRGLTLNFNWIRVSDYQQTLVTNYAVPPSAWTPFSITNPLNNTPITVYNLQPAYFGLTPALHQTNAPQSLASNSYTGFETSLTGHLPHGIFAVFGWTLEKQTDKTCDEPANVLGTALNDPNSLRFCDQTGGLYQNLGAISGVPYRNGFKLQSNIPIKYGFQFAASLYSNPVFNGSFSTNMGAGGSLTSPGALLAYGGQSLGYKMVNWSISPSTTYPLNCNCPNPGGKVDPGLTQGSEVIELVAPGQRFTPRLNQFDITLRKIFHIKERYTLTGEGQVFNLFNSSTVLTESQSLGSTITPFIQGGPGGQPSVIQYGREVRLNLVFKF